MGLTRSSSGLIRFDAFGSDTSADYTQSAGTLSVSSGYLAANAQTYLTYATTNGALCCSLLGYTPGSGQVMAGPILSQNSAITSSSATRDMYRLYYDGGQWILAKLVDNSASTLASQATPDPNAAEYYCTRIYVAGGTVTARFGATALSEMISASDATYTSGMYGGGFLAHVSNRRIDDLDIRTAHTITCTGMTTGHYLRVSDGTTTAKAAESDGTAVVDAGAVLFPLASVAIYNGDPDDGGTLVEEITNATLSDMGGGDVYSYTTISKRYFMMKKSDSDIRIMVYKA